MIEIDDFTPLVSGKKEEEKVEKDKSLEEIIRDYNEKILSLKREFEKKLEEERKSYFRKGVEEGQKKAREELEKNFQERLLEIKKEYENSLNSLSLDLSRLEKEFLNKEKEYLKRMENIFLSAVTEILEFLYINPKNASYVADKIEEIIKEFYKEKLISVEIGKGLAPFVKGKEVKVNEELNDNDFRIHFDTFAIESSIKEKLSLLREEIEREVKKSS